MSYTASSFIIHSRSKNSISIVKFAPTDWEHFKAIRLESLKNDPQAFNSKSEEVDAYPPTYWQALLASTNHIFAFAKFSNKVIGLMNLTLSEPTEPNNTAVVHNAYVTKDFRGKGIGRKLLEFLISEAKKLKNIKILKLWVKESQIPAKKLYESMGFKFTARAGAHTLIMEKVL